VPTTSKFLAQDDKDGALPTLYAATTQALPGASHVGPDGRGEPKGAPSPMGRTAAGRRPGGRPPPVDGAGSARPLTVEPRAATAAHLHKELESGIVVPYS
jgi:hypothetical protein